MRYLPQKTSVVHHRITCADTAAAAFVDNNPAAGRLFVVGDNLSSSSYLQTVVFQRKQGFEFIKLPALDFSLHCLQTQTGVFLQKPLVFAEQVGLGLQHGAAVFIPFHWFVGYPLQRIERSGDVVFGSLYGGEAAVQHHQGNRCQGEANQFVYGPHAALRERQGTIGHRGEFSGSLKSKFADEYGIHLAD